MQNAKPTGTQQVADHDRQLDTHFFQQTLYLVLQSYSVARKLHLHAGQAAPNTLFPVGHKTQDQLIGDQPPHQPLRIFEVMLAPRGARLENACAKCKPICGSSSRHTDPQYCAVDSITASSTLCSCNQIRNRSNSLGSVTNRRRAGFSSGALESTTTTIKTFLCTSIPAIFIASS